MLKMFSHVTGSFVLSFLFFFCSLVNHSNLRFHICTYSKYWLDCCILWTTLKGVDWLCRVFDCRKEHAVQILYGLAELGMSGVSIEHIEVHVLMKGNGKIGFLCCYDICYVCHVQHAGRKTEDTWICSFTMVEIYRHLTIDILIAPAAYILIAPAALDLTKAYRGGSQIGTCGMTKLWCDATELGTLKNGERLRFSMVRVKGGHLNLWNDRGLVWWGWTWSTGTCGKIKTVSGELEDIEWLMLLVWNQCMEWWYLNMRND